METRPAVLVTIIAERILRDRLVEKIRACGARGFTLGEVSGEGTSRVHPHEWEGPSVRLETLVSDEVAHRIVDEVAKYFELHSLVVYTTEVRVVRPEKFG